MIILTCQALLPNSSNPLSDILGTVQLKLYLPEVLAYLALESSDPTIMSTELPMKLDTVIVSPDIQTVNLVWRNLIIDNYQPKKATLVVMDRQSQEMLSAQHCQ